MTEIETPVLPRELAEISVRWEFVTPEMAEQALATKAANRSISPNHVEMLARDAERGVWRYSGQTVIFNKKNELMDGQHRLTMIVNRGLPLWLLVVRGVPEEAMEVIDRNRVRTLGDILSLSGEAQGNHLAASLRWLLIIGNNFDIGGKFSVTEVRECLDRHPAIKDSLNRCREVKYVSPSLLTAVHYVGKWLLGASVEADSFSEVWITGKYAYENDPAWLFREQIIDLRTKKSNRQTLQKSAQLAGLCHAWNQHRKRVSMRKFQMPQSPRIDGLKAEMILGNRPS